MFSVSFQLCVQLYSQLRVTHRPRVGLAQCCLPSRLPSLFPICLQKLTKYTHMEAYPCCDKPPKGDNHEGRQTCLPHGSRGTSPQLLGCVALGFGEAVCHGT